jgi:DNA repair protein RadD
MQLRPYQRDGLNDIRSSLGKGSRAPLYVLPTGGGKTVTYAAVAQGAAAKGNNVLILEHRKELLRQASLALAALGVRHQIIAPPDKVAAIRKAHIAKFGWPMIDQAANVAVASVQTLARRIEWLAIFNPRIIVIDEAHHAVAGTWARIIQACPNAVLVGVTATPCRADGRGLGDVFSSLILGPSMQELVDDGYLVPYRVIVPPLKVDLSGVKRADSNLDQQAALLDRPEITGDAVQHYTELTPGKPAIVCCTNIKHAMHVAESFKAEMHHGQRWRFEVVTGEMDDDLRDRRLAGLEDGSLQGIVQVEIAGEGTDIPAAEVCIMLRKTDSLALFRQQAGRVSRPVYAPGFDLSTTVGRLDAIATSSKPFAWLFDHVGNVGVLTSAGFVANHGQPTDDIEWSLEGRRRRSRGPNEEKEETCNTVQCPRCYATITPRKVCDTPRPDGSKCGYIFEVVTDLPQQAEGKLAEITADVAAAAEARRAQGQARTLKQLKAMGMSDARAQHVLAARKEKESLQKELRGLIAECWRSNQDPKVRVIEGLKPKQLRAEIERLRSELGHLTFMGANDKNEEREIA